MPATLPTHPLAVLPLKLRWPRRFDGVALAMGAAAPDVAYAFDGFGVAIASHRWSALFWWCLPVAVVCGTLVRLAAPRVAAHLPAERLLALRDYGVLGTAWPAWWVTAASALLGAASHLAWDAVTHPEGFVAVFGTGWPGPPGIPGWRPLVVVSDVLGCLVAPLLAVYVGRRRLLRAWHGPPPAVPRHPRRFWTAVGATLLVLLAALPFLPGDRWYHVQGVRLIAVVTLALLAGAAALGRPARPAAGAPVSVGAGPPSPAG